MFAKSDEINAGLVSEHGFVDHIADDLGVRKKLSVRTRRNVAEGIESKFNLL